MRRHVPAGLVLGLTACLSLSAGAARAQTYTLFSADGFEGTAASAINDAGIVTGKVTDSGGHDHGFVRAADGTITTFDPSGAVLTQPVAIDKNDAIAGTYATSDFIYHGFSRAKDGTITSIDPPKSGDTFVTGMNGGVIGFGERGKRVTFGFLYSKRAKFEVLQYPGARDTEPRAINKSGTIVGIYRTRGLKQHSFVRHPDGTFETFDDGHHTYSPVAINAGGMITGLTPHDEGFVRSVDGTITLLAAPGAVDTEPTGINASGEVIGTYRNNDDPNHPHAFVWTAENGFTEFDAPGASDTAPTGINDSGQITGVYAGTDGSGSFIRTE